MKKRLYFVCGGESCGNHLLTNLLVSCGINRGTTTYDDIKPEKLRKKDLPIVYRRSYPHGGLWPDVNKTLENVLNKKVVKKGEVLILVVVRDWYSATESSIKRGHSLTNKEALTKLRTAYKKILSQVNGFDYYFFSYDEATRNHDYVKKFMKKIRIRMGEHLLKKITNENDKFYTEKPRIVRRTESDEL